MLLLLLPLSLLACSSRLIAAPEQPVQGNILPAYLPHIAELWHTPLTYQKHLPTPARQPDWHTPRLTAAMRAERQRRRLARSMAERAFYFGYDTNADALK